MLRAYLRRIGLNGAVPPTRDGLERVMAAHIAAIPFENLDVFLGRGAARRIEAIHVKLVEARRGGWCYEQNGLLGWALEEMGFEVTRLAARVNKTEGEAGGHLTLMVHIDGQDWLVDVGFGGSQAAPLLLKAHQTKHEPYSVSLSEMDGWWRYTEDPGGKPFFYEFRKEPADPDRLEHWNTWQETDPGSNFVGNLVAQRRIGSEHSVLRGRVLVERGAAGERVRLLGDAAELDGVLRARFGLEVPEVAGHWPRVVARHHELYGDS